MNHERSFLLCFALVLNTITLFAALSIFTPGVALAEAVQSSQGAFTVKYKDGTIERYNVTWVAVMDPSVREDGHPAIPLEGKLTDTRQCYWSIAAHIDRQVFLVNKAGQQFAATTFYRTYNSDFVNKGSDFMLTALRSENCNDSRARRDSDIGNVRQSLRTAFDGVAKADRQKLIDEVKANAEVVQATFQ
jgi:hypothetical protein